MSKLSADYHYETLGDLLLIVDEDRGSRSVTNDMKQVLSTIAREHGLSSSQMAKLKIAYRDSEQTWDGVDISEGYVRFYSLNLSSEQEVLAHFSQPTPPP